MRAAGELETTGKVLLVVAPDGPVRRLLEITNLTQRFALHPTREDALAAAACRRPHGQSDTDARHGRRHRGLDGHRRSVGAPASGLGFDVVAGVRSEEAAARAREAGLEPVRLDVTDDGVGRRGGGVRGGAAWATAGWTGSSTTPAWR